MMDNIEICRLRLLKIVSKHIKFKKELLTCIKIVKRNIECTPLSKYPNGSLDYLSLPEEEIFNKEITDQQAEKSHKLIQDKKLFDQIDQIEVQKEIKEPKEPKEAIKEKSKEIIKEKKTKESKVVFDEETESNDFLKI
jgi:hypothetical protein